MIRQRWDKMNVSFLFEDKERERERGEGDETTTKREGKKRVRRNALEAGLRKLDLDTKGLESKVRR